MMTFQKTEMNFIQCHYQNNQSFIIKTINLFFLIGTNLLLLVAWNIWKFDFIFIVNILSDNLFSNLSFAKVS